MTKNKQKLCIAKKSSMQSNFALPADEEKAIYRPEKTDKIESDSEKFKNIENEEKNDENLVHKEDSDRENSENKEEQEEQKPPKTEKQQKDSAEEDFVKQFEKSSFKIPEKDDEKSNALEEAQPLQNHQPLPKNIITREDEEKIFNNVFGLNSSESEDNELSKNIDSDDESIHLKKRENPFIPVSPIKNDTSVEKKISNRLQKAQILSSNVH